MNYYILSMACLVSCLPLTLANAGPILDNAQKAEQLIEEQRYNDALNALDEALDSMWKEIPLTVRNVHYVDVIEGYGRFQLRKNNVFKPGEPLKLYVEVAGYKYGDLEDKKNMDLTIDFSMKDAKGKSIFSKEDFLNLELKSFYKNKETNLSVILNFPGLPEGDYVGVYNIRDKNSKKRTEFSMPFSISK